MYTYSAKLIRVINGDTLDLDIDLGFDLSTKQRLKLHGVNAPDSRSMDIDIKQKGIDAKQRLIDLLTKEFKVTTILNKRGKYGRILGFIYVIDSKGNEVNVGEVLVEEGHAIHYNTGK
jgi:micrococcal nuclease